ncbi:hypothetical protein AA0120_g12207 [Alternaria tenuissima]|nr:hypothetical protein AA0120_g12207 [Alternaria tenuissima]
MRPPQQDVCSHDVLPENPSDDGPIPTARKVTPNTDGVEREYPDLEEAVNLIHQSLGSDRWSSEIRNINIDFADSDPNTGRTSVGVSTIIRVTLANGTFHEGIGYGYVTDCCSKGMAFRKARESAVVDGLQTAVQYFGGISKQHVLTPGSSGDSSRSSEQVYDSALPGIELLGETKTNDSDPSRTNSAEGEFGSDPFEEMEANDVLRYASE